MKRRPSPERLRRREIIDAYRAYYVIQVKFQDDDWVDMFNTGRLNFNWNDNRYQYRIKPGQIKWEK